MKDFFKSSRAKAAAAGTAVGSVLTLLASSSFAQAIATEVNAITGNILTDVTAWIPGALAIVGLVSLVYLAYKFVRGTK